MVLVLALIDVGRKKKKDGLILVLALVVIDILVGRGGGELRFWCWHLALALNGYRCFGAGDSGWWIGDANSHSKNLLDLDLDLSVENDLQIYM